MDVIGPVESSSSNRNHYILVGIDYFTKLVQAPTYKVETKKVGGDFVRNNIVFRSRIPESIIKDNASNLNNDLMRETFKRFNISHRNSTVY